MRVKIVRIFKDQRIPDPHPDPQIGYNEHHERVVSQSTQSCMATISFRKTNFTLHTPFIDYHVTGRHARTQMRN